MCHNEAIRRLDSELEPNVDSFGLFFVREDPKFYGILFARFTPNCLAEFGSVAFDDFVCKTCGSESECRIFYGRWLKTLVVFFGFMKFCDALRTVCSCNTVFRLFCSEDIRR